MRQIFQGRRKSGVIMLKWQDRQPQQKKNNTPQTSPPEEEAQTQSYFTQQVCKSGHIHTTATQNVQQHYSNHTPIHSYTYTCT